MLPQQTDRARRSSSHTAAAAFPDLDLVLEGNGVRVILVGNTDIKNGITTTTFASTPDVPVTSVTREPADRLALGARGVRRTCAPTRW